MIPNKELLQKAKFWLSKRFKEGNYYPQEEDNLQATIHCIEIVMNLPSEEEIKNIGIDLIEKHFPKGKCKERGNALVLYAELVIKIQKTLG